MSKTKPEETQESEAQEELTEEKGKKVSAKKYQEALDALAKAEADRDHWKNEYYKAFADTANLRRSLEEEHRRALRYRSEGFLTDLLPALDAFHMALDNPAPTQEAANYQIGFTYLYNQIIAALSNEGLKEFTPTVGEEVSPDSMHALETQESEDIEPGHVIKVLTKGYFLHDRLIRPAMVVVAKAKEEAKQEEQSEEKKEETAHA